MWRSFATISVKPDLSSIDSASSGILGSIKAVGDFVNKGELIGTLETDKVVVNIVAPESGKITKVLKKQGDEVNDSDNILEIDTSATGGDSKSAKSADKSSEKPAEKSSEKSSEKSAEKPAEQKEKTREGSTSAAGYGGAPPKDTVKSSDNKTEAKGTKTESKSQQTATVSESRTAPSSGRETREKMSKMRQTIAQRLKSSQNTAAMLTTFQECDMHNLIELRNEYKDLFQQQHGVKLGFMSAFVKASASALMQERSINAYIDNDEIVYRDYVDISVAVATPTGLLTPVVRDCDKLSFADVEKEIAKFADKARNKQITMADLQGGTFTISNGGVYGSLMGTPILNPPQSAILGMHGTNKRPVVINDQVVIRPMMYLALTYDHRLIDGKQAVTFLKSIKEKIEDPRRMLLDL